MASETWRHELQPLGVRTITLYTCGVKTNYFANLEGKGTQIPETSRYYEHREFIEGIADGRLQKDAITPKQFATDVNGKIEKGATGPVWAGTNAFMARAGCTLSPQFVFVSQTQCL